MKVPGGYFNVGKDTEQKLHVDARFPGARNDEIVSFFQVMEKRHFIKVSGRSVYMLLHPMSVAVTIQLLIRVLPHLQRT